MLGREGQAIARETSEQRTCGGLSSTAAARQASLTRHTSPPPPPASAAAKRRRSPRGAPSRAPHTLSTPPRQPRAAAPRLSCPRGAPWKGSPGPSGSSPCARRRRACAAVGGRAASCRAGDEHSLRPLRPTSTAHRAHRLAPGAARMRRRAQHDAQARRHGTDRRQQPIHATTHNAPR